MLLAALSSPHTYLSSSVSVALLDTHIFHCSLASSCRLALSDSNTATYKYISLSLRAELGRRRPLLELGRAEHAQCDCVCVWHGVALASESVVTAGAPCRRQEASSTSWAPRLRPTHQFVVLGLGAAGGPWVTSAGHKPPGLLLRPALRRGEQRCCCCGGCRRRGAGERVRSRRSAGMRRPEQQLDRFWTTSMNFRIGAM